MLILLDKVKNKIKWYYVHFKNNLRKCFVYIYTDF